MNHSENQTSEFFGNLSGQHDNLWRYVQSLSPEAVAQLSRPGSPDVFQVMERNIIGMLGALPTENFDVTITTSREHLSRLLASAMMSGYFLRNAEQRLTFEKSLQAADTLTPEQ